MRFTFCARALQQRTSAREARRALATSIKVGEKENPLAARRLRRGLGKKANARFPQIQVPRAI